MPVSNENIFLIFDNKDNSLVAIGSMHFAFVYAASHETDVTIELLKQPEHGVNK